jgi:hypothetical protein
MKRLIIALIVGLAMGYNWGYDEGTAGKESVIARFFDRFGASRMRAERDAYDQHVQEAAKP